MLTASYRLCNCVLRVPARRSSVLYPGRGLACRQGARDDRGNTWRQGMERGCSRVRRWGYDAAQRGRPARRIGASRAGGGSGSWAVSWLGAAAHVRAGRRRDVHAIDRCRSVMATCVAAYGACEPQSRRIVRVLARHAPAFSAARIFFILTPFVTKVYVSTPEILFARLNPMLGAIGIGCDAEVTAYGAEL